MVERHASNDSGPAADPQRRGWEVEQKGIDWVSDSERHGRPRDLFWPWAAANLSFFPIAYGVFVVGLGLGWWQSILAALLGAALSFPLVGLVALAGKRGGAPTMTLSRAAFGYHGNKLPTLVSYLSLVGWETVSVTLGALTTRTVLERLTGGADNTVLLVISFGLTAAATIVLGVYGYDVIMRVHKWITLALIVMSVAYFALIIPQLDLSTVPTGGSLATMIGGITLVATATGLGWTNCGADYSRYLPRTASGRGVVGWTAFGGALAPVVLMLFGILLTAGNATLAGAVAGDPIGALAAQLPTWFLIPFLITVILSVTAAAVVDLYSSGLNLLALGVKLSRPVAVLIDGALMVLGGIYLIFIARDFFAPFQAFLTVIGVAMAGWSAIFLVDLVVHRRQGYLKDDLYTPRGAYGGVNSAGMISLVTAIGVGLGLITSSDPNISTVLGYFLTPEAKAGPIGASNMGVAIAFGLAALLYGLLSTTVLRPATAPALSSGR